MLKQVIHLTRDKELTPREMFLLLWLFKDGNEFTASLPEIAKSVNMKKQSTSKAMNDLARKKNIIIKQNFAIDGGRKANTYSLNLAIFDPLLNNETAK